LKYFDEPGHGFQIDARDTMYPSLMTVLAGDVQDVGDRCSTTYGFVVAGLFTVSSREGTFQFEAEGGSFFAAPGASVVTAREPDGKVVLITRWGYRAIPHFGVLEKKGRLSYIDGCSDSLLVPPQRLGDPCLNHLHFPTDILQRQHTHPSIRMGVVVRGRGVAWRGKRGEVEDVAAYVRDARDEGNLVWSHELHAGGVFMLEEQELHSFATRSDEGMDIVAFHPDSDWGPTDETHPMLNRTHLK